MNYYILFIHDIFLSQKMLIPWVSLCIFLILSSIFAKSMAGSIFLSPAFVVFVCCQRKVAQIKYLDLELNEFVIAQER